MENSIIREAKDGNKEAEQKVIESCNGMIHKIVMKYSGFADKNDLYMEGVVAVLDSIKKYDITSDTKFKTFAYKNIYYALTNYSSSNSGEFSKWKTRALYDDKRINDDTKNAMRKEKTEYTAEDDEKTKDDSTKNYENDVEIKNDIAKALDQLKDEQRNIIIYSFGLKDGEPHTIAEAAKYFKVSETKIKSIQSEALRKLRHPNSLKYIIDYK